MWGHGHSSLCSRGPVCAYVLILGMFVCLQDHMASRAHRTGQSGWAGARNILEVLRALEIRGQ